MNATETYAIVLFFALFCSALCGQNTESIPASAELHSLVLINDNRYGATYSTNKNLYFAVFDSKSKIENKIFIGTLPEIKYRQNRVCVFSIKERIVLFYDDKLCEISLNGVPAMKMIISGRQKDLDDLNFRMDGDLLYLLAKNSASDMSRSIQCSSFSISPLKQVSVITITRNEGFQAAALLGKRPGIITSSLKNQESCLLSIYDNPEKPPIFESVIFGANIIKFVPYSNQSKVLLIKADSSIDFSMPRDYQ